MFESRFKAETREVHAKSSRLDNASSAAQHHPVP